MCHGPTGHPPTPGQFRTVQRSSKGLHAEHMPHLQRNMYHVRETWVFRSFSASSLTPL